VVSRIVAALDEATQQRLHAEAPVRCLDALLHGSAGAAAPGAVWPTVTPSTGCAALDLAAHLTSTAEASVGAARAGSLFGTLAREAIAPTLIASLQAPVAWVELPPETVQTQYGRWAREGRLSDLAAEYVAQDLGQTFRYFVTRDLADFVGRPHLPGINAARALTESVADYCRTRTGLSLTARWEQDLQEVMTLDREQRVPALTPLMSQAVQTGLANLAGGER
jgi:hypothetical protein